jgi:cell division septal protein FtsQ
MDQKLPEQLTAKQALLKIHELIETEKTDRARAAMIVRWFLILIVVLTVVFLIAAKINALHAPEKKCNMNGQSIACKNNPFTDQARIPLKQAETNTSRSP